MNRNDFISNKPEQPRLYSTESYLVPGARWHLNAFGRYCNAVNSKEGVDSSGQPLRQYPDIMVLKSVVDESQPILKRIWHIEGGSDMVYSSAAIIKRYDHE